MNGCERYKKVRVMNQISSVFVKVDERDRCITRGDCKPDITSQAAVKINTRMKVK